ncbi:MAG: bifunctional nuclease family protein [Deltaproteobacteria bacterium]|nr:bifunctional nuclease family protein [Deltaproteobacteria bacterium]
MENKKGMHTGQGHSGSPLEARLKSLLFYPEKGVVVILLEEPAGKWGLPILAKSSEVTSIALALQGREPVRPLTHDLLASIITEAHARIINVLIDILEEPLCHGIIAVDFYGREMDFDSRPSDAISLAIRAHVPIYVSPAVISRGAIHFDGAEWPADLAGKAKLEN